jgi:heat shock protein HslJ
VAAAALVVVVAGVFGAIRLGDDADETVTAGPDRTDGTATTAVELGEVGFTVLWSGEAGEEPIGALRAASDQTELAELWDRATSNPSVGPVPVPSVDLDRQVVVSITIPDDACPPTLERFERDTSTDPVTIEPIFIEVLFGGCDGPLIPKTFVVALDPATIGPQFRVRLPGQPTYDYGEQVLEFPTALSPMEAQLDGRTFTGTDVVGHDLVDGTAVTLTFEGRRLSTIAGCNTASGDYRVEDGVLRVGDVWESTLIGCSAELGAQDRWLGQFLSDGPTVELEGDRLTLASGGGVAMTLTSGRQVLRGEAAGAEPLSATLELPTTTVEAGGTIEGEVVVQNDTGAPIELEMVCGSPFFIELRGDAAPQVLARTTAGCMPGLTLPVGASRWPVTVTTEYGMCRPVDGLGDPDTPACSADGSMPTLPPGTYTAEVRSEEGAPSVAGATIEVTPAS